MSDYEYPGEREWYSAEEKRKNLMRLDVETIVAAVGRLLKNEADLSDILSLVQVRGLECAGTVKVPETLRPDGTPRSGYFQFIRNILL